MSFKELRKTRWGQIKWFFSEMIKMFSNKPSYFSSKRWERWTAFVTGESFLIIYFAYHFKTITYLECLALAGAAFTVAGINMHATQKEKRFNKPNNTDDTGE